MRTCVPLWVGFGCLALCDTGVFAKAGGILGFVTMRWGDLFAGCGVYCRPGEAWGLRRCFVFCPWLPASWGCRPSPLFFFAFVWSCDGVGFLAGCLPAFPLVFHGECGVGLVNSVGFRGRLLGWGECAWAVCLSLVDASTIEG